MVLNWSCERMRLQQQPALGAPRAPRVGLTVKTALPLSVSKVRVSRGGCGSTNPPGSSHLLVVRRAAGDDAGDPAADLGVVVAEGGPRDAASRSPRVAIGQRADDVDLGLAGARDGGSSGPCEACTADIESSTVTRWTVPPVRSFSLRPRAGRISASPPCTTCERLSLVETCTVRSAVRSAASVDLGVGRGADEVAAHAEEHLGPCRRAAPGSRRRCRSRARAAARSRTRRGARRGSGRAPAPRCPSCGRPARWSGRAPGTAPAPGLPMLPWRRATLTISLIVRDGVVVLGDAHRPADDRWRASPRSSARPRSICVAGEAGRGLDDVAQSRSRDVGGVLLEAGGVLLDEVVVERRPHSSSSEPIAWNSARSPLSRIGQVQVGERRCRDR